MATTLRKLTYDDLAAIVTERESDQIELIDGVVYVTPAPRPAHERISQNINYLLERFVRPGDIGWMFTAPVDVRLSDHDVVQPDLLFIREDRLHIVGDVTINGAPDLVVEILSPGTRARDLGAKRDLYARSGVREYWLVDPEARTIVMLTLRGGRYEEISADAAGALHSALLPGLVVESTAVFALR
ncbi:MAG TPA: Uma2 family endonuclease [Thermomicrobiales bacterium]|nr:Uma2 family endonuclease [Thermomicrobiales bacterium]